MPKQINKDNVRRVIRNQGDKSFTPDDIAYESQVSSASAYLLIKELMDMGEVVLDHKDGRRMYYALKDKSGQAAAPSEHSILSLPVDDRFKYIAGIADMVIGGVSPSALITGIAGIGKTYLVRNRFELAGHKEGIDYHFVTGHSSPMGLYRFLYEHRDATIVFDDCDSVFKDAIAVNLLKSALDSYDVRKVNWVSERMPDDLEPEFNFEGSIIFISNLDESRIDEAVKSRTFVIDLQLTRKEIVEYMRSIVDVIEPDMTKQAKLEVIDYLDDVKDAFKQFNLRTFIKVARIRKGSAMTGIDWKKMALVLD